MAVTEHYGLIKHLHVALAATTLGLFLLRAWWAQRGLLARQGAWVKRLPHVIDTALLLSGLALIVTTGFTPANSHWLAIKLLLLMGYIVCGALGLHYAAPNRQGLFRSAAIALFAGIILLAHYKPALW